MYVDDYIYTEQMLKEMAQILSGLDQSYSFSLSVPDIEPVDNSKKKGKKGKVIKSWEKTKFYHK